MDPHINIDLDRDSKDNPPNTYQAAPVAGSHRSMHHHAPPAHRIASPQSHLHPQVPPPHPIMPLQRQSYYGPASPDSVPTATSAATGSTSSAPHYRRPSSPSPYGNPPSSTYGTSSGASAPSHPAHYSSSQAYGRHPDYAKDDYRYAQQDRRREYDSVELSHDYPPIARDPYRSSSPSRLHHPHPSRDPSLAPTARRPPSTAAAPAYSVHQGPTSSSAHGPIYDQEMHDRDRRSGHPYSGNSRYAARSPSPVRYGSPPGNMAYRHYYDQPQHHLQQQQGISRSFRQEYYASDGEVEGGAISQHHHYQHQPPHSSRVSSYRSWPAGPHGEATARDFPPTAAHQPLQPERYESSGSVPPPRAASPYQTYSSHQSTHSVHPPTGAWSAARSPELTSRPPLGYRRRSASVDEGIDREKVGAQSNVPVVILQSDISPYHRGASSTYKEPTYIPSRSPSPLRHVQHRSERKAPVMSIEQLLSDKPPRDATPEYMNDQPLDDRYRHYAQDHRPRESSPNARYRERTPTKDSAPSQRYSESTRGPGQLADRARMLPIPAHGHMDRSPTHASQGTTSRINPSGLRETDLQIDQSEYPSATTAPPRDDRKVESLLHEDSQSTSTASTKTEVWPEADGGDASSAMQDVTDKSHPPTQVKRRPKAEHDKRATKAKTEEKEAPAEETKIKAKRGRKPKTKDNPLEAPSLPLLAAPVSATFPRVDPLSNVSNGALKRLRGLDVMSEDREFVDLGSHGSQATGMENGVGTRIDGSDSDREDYSQHKDLMNYMLEVHRRGQKVQKAYEKQSSRKRRKLHEKFLVKQERRMEAKTTAEGAIGTMEDEDEDEEEGFLGTRDPSMESQVPPQHSQTIATKGKGRGRKRLQIGQGAEGNVKNEQDEDNMPKETKAERKRRERKEASDALAMAHIQAIKAKARAQEQELGAHDEGDDDDQDAHVPRSNLYDDESDDQSYGHDRRIDFEVSDEDREEMEPTAEMDEEALARRQEKEYEVKRRAIWDLIAHRQIREMTKIVANTTTIKLQNCKKVAQLCQREARKAATRSVKPSKEVHTRARKANREMLIFWKRNEREEREMRKKAEKEAIEKLRIEEEMREARRQARKLNFLITQTELYSHFIGKKIGTEAAEADDDAAPVRMQPSKEAAEMSILQDPDHTPVEGELDFEEASDETLAAQAKWGAQQALLAAQQRTKTFDEEAKESQEQKSNISLNQTDLDEMNFQNPSSMPTVTEIEQPKMLMCQLKGYQIKGLNWLANLYEQGINGILADEMGLGKTVQSISLMAYLAETQNIWGPFLVIAPASTLHNWQQEFTKFTPELKALPYWGNIKDRKTLRKFWNKKQVYSKDAPFHILITSYQLVVSDEKYFQRVKWQYMVLDEAQAIKSSSSARWKTLLGFNCRNRLLLTGTPIQNSMQELWALLHFIMPSLFDSHEEFSEWFSKDIESHAENKGTLNEHQLKRLHMILKPFMLRRIKKNVQNELGDKIELEVSCELTARQRALYRGLKEKISISELLEKASSLDDSDSVDSLMNLVMQFRKVCNHPELFERADVVSPLALCSFSQTPSIAREGDDLYVAYTTRSKISYSVPKRLYREGGILRVPSENSNAGADTKYLDQLMNIWTPDYIQESMFEEQGTFSFLRFADYSPSQASKISRGHLLERFALHLEMAEGRSRRGYATDSDLHELEESGANYPGNTFAKLLISETANPFSIGNQSLLSHTEQLGHVLQKSELGEYLSMMEPAYRPKAVAPPIEMVCSDRGFLVDQHEQLFNSRIRQALLGVSDFRTEAAHQAEVAPMMDLWRVNNGRGLIGEPSLSLMGYSTIEVPQMKQLVMDSGKLAVLDKLLVELKAGGHRVLVYFQMTKMIDLMEEYLTYRQYKYLRLDGSSKISDRRDMVTDWQTRPEIFIFLLSTRAGGLGINLTAADTVIFYDSDWNPTVDQQAMDRAHRLGQTRQVTVYRLITRGTIEERILQRAKQKDEIQKVVISGGEFKQNVEFKPREIVSLLLDDDELATKLQEQQVKRKVEEEEAKNQRKGTSKTEGGRPTKKSKKESKDGKDTSSSTPVATPGKGKTLDEMWPDTNAQGGGETRENTNEGSSEAGPAAKGKRARISKEKPPKEPKPKKEKEPKVKKQPKLGKKAQAAAAAAAAAAEAAGGGGLSSELGEDADVDVDIDMMEV
ncbi:putative DNA helicase ino80 [Mortierella sp. AM989]|nr:putative DNA helicase ino80 [Mortierella sp. AM989]